MKGLSFPPLTRVTLIVYIVLSIICVSLKYSALVKVYDESSASKATTNTVPDPESPEEGSDGLSPNVNTMPAFRDMLVPYMTLVPSMSINYPWVLITSSFIEQSLTNFLITGATLAYAGKYCERVWGSNHLAIFLGIQSIIPNLLCAVLLVVLYALNRNYEALLTTTINGGLAIQTGYLVAFRQLVPEHSIVLFNGIVKAKVKFLIMPIIYFYTIVGLALNDIVMVFLPWLGFFTSWVYLRFYKISYVDTILPLSSSLASADTERVKIRGDASDTFSFANFFYPAGLRDVISTMSQFVFSLFVALRICSQFNEDEVEAGNFRASIRNENSRNGNNANGGGGSADADRRRALALKVLEERLDGNSSTTNDNK